MDVVIGRIGRPHGIRGEVSVEVRTDEPDRWFTIGAVLATDPVGAGPLTVRRVRRHGDRLLLMFQQVPDRGAAEGLRGVLLTADVDQGAWPDDPEEFHDRQLVGLCVHDQHGHDVGEVVAVLHAPAHELLVVRRKDGAEALVPFVRALVPDVDLDTGRVVVADRPGLLDPETLG
ncbi:MAG: ribosome maturation factor RimM [Actinomycetota bacterium]|nr:ribosome maturation factor RimM [Actinomycetota bacterium]